MPDLTREVLAEAAVREDLEVHFSKVTAPESGEFLEIREYVPSLQQYGRGTTIPLSAADALVEALETFTDTLKYGLVGRQDVQR